MELDRLPDHILIKIFQCLGNYDLLVFRGVNSRWFRLLKCKKYFDRIHRLKFTRCLLSTDCPPLSVFKKSFDQFFRYLTIDNTATANKYNCKEIWNKTWSHIGSFITHLKFDGPGYDFFQDVFNVLGDGSNWPNLIVLDVAESKSDIPNNMIIPSLKTLKLRNNSSAALERIFPNLVNLYIELTYDDFLLDEWQLQRLRGVDCGHSFIPKLNTDTIQQLSLYLFGSIPNCNAEYIESFIRRQKDLSELKIAVYDMSFKQWSHWIQITELYMNVKTYEEPIRYYLVHLKNLKHLQIDFCSYKDCFFGHEPVDLPCLENYFFYGEENCENCWINMLKSCASAKKGVVLGYSNLMSHLELLKNLESLRFDSCKPVDKVESSLDIKLPNFINLNYCPEKFDNQLCKEIEIIFPNLRSLKIHTFNPILLTSLPLLENLHLSFADWTVIEGISRFGKNLRILTLDGEIKEKHAKHLFRNLKLLLKIYVQRKLLFTRNTLTY